MTSRVSKRFFLVSAITLSAWCIFGCGAPEADIPVKLGTIWAADSATECAAADYENANTNYQQDHLPTDLQQIELKLFDRQGGEVSKKTVRIFSSCADDGRSCLKPSAQRIRWSISDTSLLGPKMTLLVIGSVVDLNTQELKAIWSGKNTNVDLSGDLSDAIEVQIFMKRINAVTRPFFCANVPRAFHTATRLRDGTILIAGGVTNYLKGIGCDGQCDSLVATNSVERFDPYTGTFTVMKSLNSARAFHQAVQLDDGQVLFIGGASRALFNPTAASLAAVGVHYRPENASTLIGPIELYNPEYKNTDGTKGSSLNIASIAKGRMLFTLSSVPAKLESGVDSFVYLMIGGVDADGRMDSAELFNYRHANMQSIFPQMQSTLLSARLNAARAGHAAFVHGSAPVVILFGGAAAGGAPAERIDLSTAPNLSFVIPTVSGLPRNVHYAAAERFAYDTATTPATSKVLVYGGLVLDSNDAFLDPATSAGVGTQVVIWDGSTLSVTQGSSQRGSAFNAMAMAGDRLIAAGGVNQGFSAISNNFEQYNPSDNSYALLTDNDGANLVLVSGAGVGHGRFGHTATLLPDNAVLFVGGLDIVSLSPEPGFTKKPLNSAEMVLMDWAAN